MKLSEMRETLSARDIQLTKSLGQNFLHDTHQLDRIVAAAELTKTDKVLEIGPGLGPLTELLVAQGGEVLRSRKTNVSLNSLRKNSPERRILNCCTTTHSITCEHTVNGKTGSLWLIFLTPLRRRSWLNFRKPQSRPSAWLRPCKSKWHNVSQPPRTMMITAF